MQPYFPLLLDGPMGTELERHGVDVTRRLWSALANETHPELVQQIHLDYIKRGVDVITANCFRTNTRAVVASGLTREDAHRLTVEAVRHAIAAREHSGRRDVFIAGSDAPVEDCYHPELVPTAEELRAEHEEHIAWQVAAGCDLMLIETMNKLDEAVEACHAAAQFETPFIISLVTDFEGRNLLSGESLAEAVAQLEEFAPMAIMTNCTAPSAAAVSTSVLAEIHAERNATWEFGSYANGSTPDPVHGYDKMRSIPMDEYMESMAQVLNAGAQIVGTCCGTTPEFTTELRMAVDRVINDSCCPGGER